MLPLYHGVRIGHMTNISYSAPILVTGGGGYIASWIVRYLLETGHVVHATVRDPQGDSVRHLRALAAQHDHRLRLFPADLLTPGSFDAAMQDCELVLHTA